MQRKALAVRDGGCLVPACRVPVALADVHHVIPWSRGGPTDLGNLVAVCPRHHTAVHAGVWRIEFHGDLPWVIPPHWVDPQRRPIRNLLPGAVQEAIKLGQDIRADDDTGDTDDRAEHDHGPEPP
jgi:hypothetical protein